MHSLMTDQSRDITRGRIFWRISLNLYPIWVGVSRMTVTNPLELEVFSQSASISLAKKSAIKRARVSFVLWRRNFN